MTLVTQYARRVNDKPPPLDKTPSIMLNFGWHLTVLGEVSIFVGYAYAINGHFVRHKQTGNKIGASSIIV